MLRLPFRAQLAAVAAVALGLRWLTVVTNYRNLPLGLDDNFFYHWQARALAQGKGFLNPFYWADTGAELHSAAHPPLYSVYLGVVSWFGGTSPLAHRLASGVLGAVCVILVGILARRLTGSDRAGILAALAAALYPNLWINDGLILSESLYAPLIAGVLLAAHAFVDEPTPKRSALLGALIALAALTRSEALILFGLLVLPLVVWTLRDRLRSWRERLGLLAVCGVTGGVLMLPWVGFNYVHFEEPTFLAVGAGFVIDIANCDATYHGDKLGYWDPSCGLQEWPEGDESVIELAHRRDGTAYIREHLGRAPVVAAARVGRMWNLYRPQQGVDLDAFFERRGKIPATLGLWSFYGLVVLSFVGVRELWRRRVTLVPMASMVVMVTITAAVSIGITRYRVAGEVVLVVLGGIGLDAVVRRLTRQPVSA